MINSLLVLAILVWPFGQLLTFSFGSINFYTLDLILGILTALQFFSGNVYSFIKKYQLTKSFLGFILVATISLLLNYKNLISAGYTYPILYLGRLVIYFCALLSTAKMDSSKIWFYIKISVSIFLVLSLSQYLFFPDMRYLKNLGFDDHYYRLIGTFYDPNFTGAFLAALSTSLISVGSALSIIPIILLALTFSRASYLAFAIVLIAIIIEQRKFKLLMALVFLGILVYLTPKPFGEGVNLARTFSVFSRLGSWQAGIDLFLRRPILGWGYNTLNFINNARYQIDNSLIFISATTGTVGLFSFVGVLVKSAHLTKKSWSKPFLLTLLIHSMFNNSLFFIWLTFPIMIVLGLELRRVYKID